MSKLISRNTARDKGLKLFFTGKPCKRGHIAPRYVWSASCFLCHKLYCKKNRFALQLKRYGLSVEQYKLMLKKQNNKCEICKKKEITIDYNTKKRKKMSVDHCHKTGKVRALLCNNCNQGLGKFKHDPAILKSASLYCEKHA